MPLDLRIARRADDPPIDPKALEANVVMAGRARFTLLTPALVRLEWSPRAEFEDRASFAFIHRGMPAVEHETRRGEDGWLEIETAELLIRYKEENSLEEAPRRGAGAHFDAENLSILPKAPKYPSGEPCDDIADFVWRPGMRATGNLGGTVRTLDMVSGATPLEPGLLSRDGWALVDDSARPLLDDTLPGYAGMPWAAARRMIDGDSNSRVPEAIDWYFFGYGRDYTRALRDFTRVAGRIPLPPRYTYGHWWSRYWSYSDEEFRDLVRQYDEHDVPIDVLVVDMGWHLDGWTGYTWHPELFSDPDGFLQWVHEQGLRTTLNLHPHDGIGRHESQFPAMAAHMGVDPESVERIPFDCADPRFVDGYFRLVHHPEERRGVDFWWMDWQQGELTNIEGLDPLFWLNYLHWEDWARQPERADERPLIFSRWGGLGNHRYQIGFSGDTYCNWESLRFQVEFTATAGNVGYGFWSHDIGGHQPGPVDPELYVRWIQFAVFNPFLRTHTTMNAEAERRIWAFDKPYFEAAKAAFELRYALIPYIYSEARKSFDDALPLCRPMYYEWPEEDEAYRRPGQYMFGDQLLVAPVTQPSNVSISGDDNIWLPPGEWREWTANIGGAELDATKEEWTSEFPIYARAGSIIPMYPFGADAPRRSGAVQPDPLVLCIFEGDKGRYEFYEDDGISNAYINGGARTPFEITRSGNNTYSLRIGPTIGQYANQIEERSYYIVCADWISNIQKVAINGSDMKEDLCGSPIVDNVPGIERRPIQDGWSATLGYATEPLIYTAARSIREALVITIVTDGFDPARALAESK